jgi:hypothetical protein
MDIYRIVTAVEGGREYFSVAVAQSAAPERQLPVRFNTRADAEATVAYLKRSFDRLPSPRKAATARHGRNGAS